MSAPSSDAPWTVARLLDEASRWLAGKGLDSPRLEAELLLAHVLGRERVALYLALDMLVTDEERARFRELARRLARGEPSAYVLGRRAFYELDFRVDPRVLIPRPETEHLVDAALAFLEARSEGEEAPRIVDLGTGSGCISISLAHRHPEAIIHAVDLSFGALEVARANAAELVPEAEIHFHEGSWWRALPPELHFDLVVSNPPYVLAREAADLSVQVREHEPSLALFGAGEAVDPIAAHVEIVQQGRERIRPGGRFLLELGEGGAAAWEAWWPSSGLPGEVAFIPDLQGIRRVLSITWPE